MYIDQKRILDETNGGLTIILDYYPQAQKCVDKAGKKFKLRETEKTPSATIKKLTDGVYVVTDFGGDAKPRNAIHIVMEEEGLLFKEALEFIATKFNILPDELKADIFKPDISSRDAEPNENEGEWYFDLRDKFTDLDIKTVLADNAIPTVEKEKDTIDYERVEKIFKRYHFYSLKSYSICKNRKVTTIAATDTYPIFMWDEGRFKKIYQPLSPDKSRRFIYYGERPKEYLHGLDVVKSTYEANVEEGKEPEVDLESGEVKPIKPKKLPEIIYCSGGSDGMNLAMLGYQVVWPNSETSKLKEKMFRKLQGMAEKVLNMGDIDATGKREAHRLCMEHLELHNIVLPEELLQRYDRRGNACKDVRDFLKYYNGYDFKNLVKTALPYQFWEVEYSKTKSGRFKETYQPLNTEMYNFLARNGFYRLELKNEKEGYIYVHIEDHVVKDVKPADVRDYVNKFLESRMLSPRLRDVFYRSNQLNESSLANLPLIDIDFNSYDKKSQYFFFLNRTVEVTAGGLKEFKPGEVQRYVWKDEVIQHRVKVQDPHFRIFKGADDRYDIEILKKDNIFLNFMINISRVHWRKELEESLEGKKAEEIAAYKDAHRFDIAGPNLAPEEIMEQKEHLINKIYTLGFFLHKYKDKTKNWAGFGMDARMSDTGESHGGSGKSIFFDAPNHFMKHEYLPGRNPKLTDNPHLYEGITKHTFFVLVDDCAEYLNFQFFFDAITGKIKVNPKNNRQYTLEFNEVPKFGFTSNFSLRNQDSSTLRRLLFTVNSDYYHHNKDGFYNEDWAPKDEFGVNLLTDEMSEEQWNDFNNLAMQCCSFFIGHDKVDPPMNNVERRNLLAIMGAAFHEWCDVYFSEESRRRDEFVPRTLAFEDFKRSTKSQWTSQKYGKALEAWCRYYGYELNPKEFHNGQGRIIRFDKLPGEVENKSLEMIYIRTVFNGAALSQDSSSPGGSVPLVPSPDHSDVPPWERPDEPENLDKF